MQQLIRVFWDISLWRRGPRDLPASRSLLAAVALAYTAVSALQSRLMYGPSLVLARALADLALTVAVFWATLAIAQRPHRFLQTAIAVLGTGTLLSLPLVALQLAATQVGPQGPAGAFLSIASVPLLVWYLFVVGHIVRLALEAPWLTGMAVAMTYFVLSYVALVQFPGAGP
jgi:hypothetical protein